MAQFRDQPPDSASTADQLDAYLVAVERAPSGKGLRMGVVEPRTAAMSDAAMHLGALK